MLHQDKHLVDFIAVNEGLRLKPYKDSVGVWTIGYGYNMEAHGIPAHLTRKILEDKGITTADAENLLLQEVAVSIKYAMEFFPEMSKFTRARQFVCVDMLFNLGPTRFAKFKPTIDLMNAGDWKGAVERLKRTLWYKQVKTRAVRNCKMLLTGEFQS